MLLVRPTESQQIVIREALNEDLETRDSQLEIIKDWLREQPHLPDNIDDARLMSFLRGSRFCLNTCQKKLEKYFTVRATMPEFFADRDIRRPELQQICDLADACILPRLTPGGGRVSIVKAVNPDFETPDLADAIKLVFMASDIRLKLEEVGVLCDIYIADAGFPLTKHFFNVSPQVIRKLLVCVQEAYPVLIGELHVVNAPPLVDFAIKLIKPLMNEELRNCIHVHRDVESVYEFVPKEILPEEFGGDAGPIAEMKKKWMEALEENLPWFEEQEEVKADISENEESGGFLSSIFGFVGNFQQLYLNRSY